MLLSSQGSQKIQKLIINFEPHEQQKIVMSSKARFRVLACGRRWGKTTLSIFELLTKAWQYPESVNWWVAPTYRQSRIGFRILKRILKDTGIMESKSETGMFIKLTNGSLIEFKSADKPDNLHGEGLKMVVIDEAARIRNESVWYEALRPALADTQGYALLISTPKGKNWFYTEWMKGFKKEEDYESWTFPTWGNPYIPEKEIERLRKNMPEREFHEQIMAMFLDRGGAVFPNVKQIIDPDIKIPVPPSNSEIYIAGVDLGKSQDYTVITILDSKGRMVYWERFSHISWTAQKEKIIRALKMYNATACVDATAYGDPIVDDLRILGLNIIPFKFSQQSKTALIQKLILAVENKNIRIANIPQLIAEMDEFEYAEKGSQRYYSPEHDDCVMSLALAVWIMNFAASNLVIAKYEAPTIDEKLNQYF